MLVGMLLEFRIRELSFLVIDIRTSFGVDSGVVVADHGDLLLLLIALL